MNTLPGSHSLILAQSGSHIRKLGFQRQHVQPTLPEVTAILRDSSPALATVIYAICELCGKHKVWSVSDNETPQKQDNNLTKHWVLPQGLMKIVGYIASQQPVIAGRDWQSDGEAFPSSTQNQSTSNGAVILEHVKVMGGIRVDAAS